MHTLGTALLLFRPGLLLFGALAQVYLFLRVRHALQASAWSARFRARATWGVGAAMVSLWALHAYVVLARLPWVEPPALARVGLLVPAVVGTYGSILSALVLLGLRAGGRLGHLVARGWHPSAGAAPPAAVEVSRRRVLQAGVAGLAVAPFALVGYGTAYATRAYRVTALSLPFGRALRVLHLSDLHAGVPHYSASGNGGNTVIPQRCARGRAPHA